MKCAYLKFCCDQDEEHNCVGVEGECDMQISDREYQLLTNPDEARKADYADKEKTRHR
jgi:hypothetical protein